MEGGEVLTSVTHGALLALERHDAACFADSARQRHREKTSSRVQLHDSATDPGLIRAERTSNDGVREHLGASHVRLPETGGAHVVRLECSSDGHVPAHSIYVDARSVRCVGILAYHDDRRTRGGRHRAHALPRLP